MLGMTAALLAQSDGMQQMFEGLRSAFRAEGTTWPALVRGIGIAIVALIVASPVILGIRALYRRLDPSAGPQNLFRAALRVCGVGAVDRGLLLLMARRLRLANPTAMLLAQPLYEDLVKQGTKRMPSALRDWARARLVRLEGTFFIEEDGAD